MHSSLRRRALVVLVGILAASTGCDSDRTTAANPPPVTPPAPPAEPAPGLWVAADATPAIVRFAPAQLAAGGQPTPATILTTPSATLATANNVAFDGAGTLWVTSQEDSVLLAFPASALTSSGSRDARVRITSKDGSLSGPRALAFDRMHRLWVANIGNGTLVRFDSAQLASSGAPAPAVVISGLGRPSAMAFDAVGSLWVADIEASTLSKYSVAQLLNSGSPPAQFVISRVDSSLNGPGGLAFDSSGTLWVTNVFQGTVVGFARAQLGNSGAPAPRVTLTPPNPTPNRFPTGLAFDDEGSLWVMDATGALEKFDAASLATSGSPLPRVRLTMENPGLPWGAAFWPKPAGLPLF